MTRSIPKTPHHREGGFTLVELLVVVVILGILAAVVVISVRGSNDKGERAAIDTDARVLRTAEEAYCALHGKYATEAELVNGKFLSDYSTYHRIDVEDRNSQPVKGPCNGWWYDLVEDVTVTLPPPPPTCNGLPANWPRGKFCAAAAPAGKLLSGGGFSTQLVQLPTGKVLALMEQASTFGTTPTEVFDPAAGDKGGWAPSASLPATGGVHGMVAIRGARSSSCPHCGKVLVQASDVDPRLNLEAWYLFDPLDETWTKILTPAPDFYTRQYVAMVQLNGASCGAHCGKVLIVEPSPDDANYPPPVRLYDPKDNSFTPLTFPEFLVDRPIISPVNSGEVLILSQDRAERNILGQPIMTPAAFLYRPTTGQFVDVGDPTNAWPGDYNTAVPIGSTGRVLVAGVPGHLAEVYGSGAFGSVGGCGGNPSPYCHLLASLPDGRVLAKTSTSSFRTSTGNAVTTYLFNPTSGTWSAGGELHDGKSATAGVVLDSALGGCGGHCGRVLVVGDRSAELFVP